MGNTRFNPTVNGPLHIGHLYTILVNQTEARRGDGKFVIRFDDTSLSWSWLLGEEQIDYYRQVMRDDMQWLGIEPVWSSQAALMEKAEGLAKFLGYPMVPKPFTDQVAAEVVGATCTFYPMTERQTAEHVLMDFIEGVTWCIRGIDLLSEDAFYKYLVKRYDVPRVRMTYIPRLAMQGDVISKTAGNFKLCDFRRAGIDPDYLINCLADDCLIHPGDQWTVDNIKPVPVLGDWAKAVLHGVS